MKSISLNQFIKAKVVTIDQQYTTAEINLPLLKTFLDNSDLDDKYLGELTTLLKAMGVKKIHILK